MVRAFIPPRIPKYGRDRPLPPERFGRNRSTWLNPQMNKLDGLVVETDNKDLIHFVNDILDPNSFATQKETKNYAQ
jgi:hypothetical protein